MRETTFNGIRSDVFASATIGETFFVYMLGVLLFVCVLCFSRPSVILVLRVRLQISPLRTIVASGGMKCQADLHKHKTRRGWVQVALWWPRVSVGSDIYRMMPAGQVYGGGTETR